jgi:hypothetical protein
MVRECSECGRPFISNVASKLTCSKECSDIRRKKYNDEKNAKAREATKIRNGTRICVTCGKEFAPSHSIKVCCSPECQKERGRQMAKEAWRSTKQTRAKKPKSTEKQIIDINAKAKAMGMTYGQYVAYIEGKKLWNGSQRKTDS